MMQMMYSTQELECLVLGCLMNGGATPDAFDVIASTPSEAFSVAYYRQIYGVIKAQALSGGLIDMMYISEAIGGQGTLVPISPIFANSRHRSSISKATPKKWLRPGEAEPSRNYCNMVLMVSARRIIRNSAIRLSKLPWRSCWT